MSVFIARDTWYESWSHNYIVIYKPLMVALHFKRIDIGIDGKLKLFTDNQYSVSAELEADTYEIHDTRGGFSMTPGHSDTIKLPGHGDKKFYITDIVSYETKNGDG